MSSLGCVVDPSTADATATQTDTTEEGTTTEGGDGDGDEACADVRWALEPVVSSESGRTAMLGLDAEGRAVVLYREATGWVSRTRVGDGWAAPIEIGQVGDRFNEYSVAYGPCTGLLFAGTRVDYSTESSVPEFAELPPGQGAWTAPEELGVAAPFGQGAVHDTEVLVDGNDEGQSIISWQEFTGIELQRFLRTRESPQAEWSSAITMGPGWGERARVDERGDVWSAAPSADFSELTLARWSLATGTLDSPPPIALTTPGPALNFEVIVAGEFVAVAWRERDPAQVIAYAAVYDIAAQAWVGVQRIDGNEIPGGDGAILDFDIVGDAAGNIMMVMERTSSPASPGIIHWRRFDATNKQWGEIATVWSTESENWDMHVSMNAAGDALWSKRTLDAVEMTTYRATERSWDPVTRFERPGYFNEDRFTTVITPDGQRFVAWTELEGPERGVHVARACI